jgi:hypothetical protein
MRDFLIATSTGQHLDKEKLATESIKTLPGEELREGLYHE